MRLTPLKLVLPFLFVATNSFVSLCAIDNADVLSPNGKLKFSFTLQDGKPTYSVFYESEQILADSELGFQYRDRRPEKFTTFQSERVSIDDVWEQPWGESSGIRNHCNELKIELATGNKKSDDLVIRVRVFDDGLGFRYEWPKQSGRQSIVITDELTEFNFVQDGTCWWIPAYSPIRYENLYTKSRISDLKQRDDVKSVETPLTIRSDSGRYIVIHEAALTDYASMTLSPNDALSFECDLVPWSDGTKIKAETPHVSPWRVILTSKDLARIFESTVVLNLNEPCRISDTSWIEPCKYVGIWWAMHIGKHTWWQGEKLGATTSNTKKYIDFAARNGFRGVLVEGWNQGWTQDWISNAANFSFTKPVAEYDLEELAEYAQSQGVRLIGHHETGCAVDNYEHQIEEAFKQCQRLGIRTVKTGYVNDNPAIQRLDKNGNVLGVEWQHGQYMVRHYRKVVETAAKYNIAIVAHEPIKDTGIRRTWPNMMTREGARGQEFNAWDSNGGNPPSHTAILPFTRMLAGPMDFTPGIFDIEFKEYRESNRVNTTLAKQLALYVVLYSPLHMVTDLPENYRNHPAFQFVLDVPTDWNQSKLLAGEVGEYCVVARQSKLNNDWFIGAITNENQRELEFKLDFLDADVEFVATIYRDTAATNWMTNPLDYQIQRMIVNRSTILKEILAPGGGQAIRISPATDSEQRSLAKYHSQK